MRRGYDEVQRFAGLMLAKLNTPKNAAKRPFTECTLDYLRKRLAEERQEVDDAIDAFEHGEATAEEVFGELADEGNFCMMIHNTMRRQEVFK